MPDRPITNRLPDWWRAKPEQLPEPSTDTSPDWWDELYSGDDVTSTVKEPAATVAAEPRGEGSGTTWWTAQPGYYPRPHPPAWLTEAPARIPLSPKTRAALYNASAAGTGWALGLYDPFAGALASCGTDFSISGALVLGTGGCLLIAHLWDRRTRHWWPGLAWAARIPLATAVLALALWAPAA
ncbi:hypothetical protein [Streptomyces sp. AVP053U2]|uniref:hypothetical protein n=1 Tax=Streptomyces sp. AVP053U2 TaxID=1737066 RepID=UPI00114D0D68|nr:hypothetical protein [Streptomyces sp. AVP053U2]